MDKIFNISASEVFSVHAPYSGIINVFGEGERHMNLDFHQSSPSNTKLYIYYG